MRLELIYALQAHLGVEICPSKPIAIERTLCLEAMKEAPTKLLPGLAVVDWVPRSHYNANDVTTWVEINSSDA